MAANGQWLMASQRQQAQTVRTDDFGDNAAH
jgi:hypothetical protein